MQISEKYKDDYEIAMEKFKDVRKDYFEKLSTIKNLRVVPSQANYILCEVLESYTAKELTEILLDEHDLFIKDLSSKKGFNGEFIRVAVKRPEENDKLVDAIREILN